MKTLFFGIVFSMSTLVGFGQKSYDDLQILYADGNYEKLIKVATKYTSDDATRKDPLPHLWMARGYYKISISGSDDPEDKNAFKDAVGAVAKFLKADKGGEAMSDPENSEFVETMQAALFEQISNDIATDNYRKAYSWVIKYNKISNNSLGSKYLEAACKFRTDDKSTAFTMWRECEAEAAKITDRASWSPTDLDIMKSGVLESAECLVSVRQVDKAKALVNKIAPWFEDDEEFKTAYNEILY